MADLTIYTGFQPRCLTKELDLLVKGLVTFQHTYEFAAEEDLNKMTPFSLGNSEEDKMMRIQHMTEMTVLTVKLLVDYSKNIPGFIKLPEEDQITLLKAYSSDLLILKAARKYNMETDSIVFANNKPYTRMDFHRACIGEVGEAIFHFCRTMCSLRVDKAEYALLKAIVVFSDHPNLLESKLVQKMREYYIENLRAYTVARRPEDQGYLARLLSLLGEARTLSIIIHKQCFSIKIQYKKLPPFLEEFWNIGEENNLQVLGSDMGMKSKL